MLIQQLKAIGKYEIKEFGKNIDDIIREMEKYM